MLSTSPGHLFSEAERAWLDVLAARLRAEGFDCFVPHENFPELADFTPSEVYRIEQGVRRRRLVAWLDGPIVDDGTACEIGMFAELVAGGDPRTEASSASSPTSGSNAGAGRPSATA